MKCTICNNSNTKFFLETHNTHGKTRLTEEVFDLFHCENCNNYFLANMTADANYYKTYYPEDYYSGEGKLKNGRVAQETKRFVKGEAKRGVKHNLDSLLNRAYYSFSKRYAKKREKLILRHASTQRKKLSILDVGCGDGEFLQSLDNDIFEKTGIDLNERAIELTKKRGLQTFSLPVQKVDTLNKSFDVITMWHVLEHVEDPVETLQQLKKVMRKSGIVVISVPCADSLGFRLGKQAWFHMDSPRHLFIPTVSGLKFILNSAGFKNVTIHQEKFDFPLDLLWSTRGHPLRYLVWALYPILKLMDKETLTAVCTLNK